MGGVDQLLPFLSCFKVIKYKTKFVCYIFIFTSFFHFYDEYYKLKSKRKRPKKEKVEYYYFTFFLFYLFVIYKNRTFLFFVIHYI